MLLTTTQFIAAAFRVTVIVGLFSVSSLATAAEPPTSLTLNGHDYALELQANHRLAAKVKGTEVDASQHYRGRLNDVAGSWVRLSKVDGQWTGLASVAGQTYMVQGGSLKAKASFDSAAASAPGLQAVAVSDLQHKDCGLRHPPQERDQVSFDHSVQQAAAHSVFQQPNRQAASFSALCTQTLNGVCMLAEIEFIFDQQFQNKVSDPQATATSIVNLVEGYYEDGLSVAFDTITMQFLDSEVFTSSTDADELLGGTDPDHPVENPTSLRALSSSGQLSFEKSRSALLHLVTGRDFDDGTAGIAFTDVLCNDQGYASGTSQYLGESTGNPAAVTALVTAHEIGHNFGAVHDGSDNACAAGSLMEPALSSSNTGFSTCSVSEIETSIGQISSLGQCFNFPIDVSVLADSANPSTGEQGVNFDLNYDLTLEVASEAIAGLSISGLITGDGRFVAVNLNGAACTVTADALSYSCALGSPGTSAQLEVTAVSYADSVSYRHTATATGNSDLVDLAPANNAVISSLTFSGAAQAPSQPEPTTPVTPAPTPTATPTQAQTPAAAEESGGGGGAFGVFALFGLSLLVAIRRLSLLALATTLAACQVGASSSQTDPSALSLSAKADDMPDSYSVVQQRSCYCAPDYTRPIRVWVSEGEISRAEYAEDGSAVSSAVMSSLHSVEHWQQKITQWREHEPNRLELAYDKLSGQLTEIDFDPSAMKADDEFKINFSDYQN